MRPRPVLPVAVLVSVLAVAAGCSRVGTERAETGTTGPLSTAPVELTVYAAASLKEAMAAVGTAYEAEVPGILLTIAIDSSATLRTQIEQGAPADLFLSADEQNPQALVDADLADGVAVGFAGNKLAIVVPLDNPAGIASPADLARLEVTIVAAGDEVPISGYARQVVDRLASLPGYPGDFAAAYAANIVSKEENAKGVVAKVELGEADAAMVYATDARTSTRVKAVEIPPEANVTATYAGVVVKSTAHPTEAHAFLDWLAGSRGVAILTGFGFEGPR